MLLRKFPPAGLKVGVAIEGTVGVKLETVASEPHLENKVNGPVVAPIGTKTVTEVDVFPVIKAITFPENLTESVLERLVPEITTSSNPTAPLLGENPETVGFGKTVAVTLVLKLEHPEPSIQATKKFVVAPMGKVVKGEPVPT